jgi:hypothetical protein
VTVLRPDLLAVAGSALILARNCLPVVSDEVARLGHGGLRLPAFGLGALLTK